MGHRDAEAGSPFPGMEQPGRRAHRERMTILESSLNGFSGVLLRPGDDGYEQGRRVWNGSIDRRPAFIARCRTRDDVSAAVRFGVRHGLSIAVRGGGHSIPGLSVCEGGLVVDLSLMKAIALDLDQRQARVEPGVLWRELDAATQVHGVAVPGGEISHTGVAGLTLGGGVGWLCRLYGLACDNLLAAELVTAEGTVVHTDEAHEPELLWGLRGGGGNFGVVTRFTFRLNPVPVPIFAGMVLHPLAEARAALRGFLDVAERAPDALGLNAALVTAPPADFVPPYLRGKPVVALAAAYVGPFDEGAETVRPIRESGAPAVDLFGPMPFTAVQSMADDAMPPGLSSYARSEWLQPLDEAGVDALVSAAEGMTSPMSQVLLRIMGGAVARVSPDATAFRFRGASAMTTLAAVWPDTTDPGERHREWARASWQRLLPWSAGGGYVNHLCDEGADRVREAYGEPTWKRLVGLKRRYDPRNVFQLNQNIPPARP
jgi:FAD/FMN-containing dehydrogenase